jgi:predicted SnoaL-like aldol condensation-catalyzing enzyme
MKQAIWLPLAAALALAACSKEPAAPASAADPKIETARAAITDYADLLMIRHQPEEAFGKYYADLLIQHDPWIGDGGKGDVEFLKKRREAEPDKYDSTEQYVSVIHNIMTDGEFVAIKSHIFTNPKDKGREFVDIWKLENGKFAEHWDIIQPLDEAMARTVGCGVGGTYDAAKQAGNTVAKPVCGAPDPTGDAAANKQLVLASFKADHPAAKVERTIADGNLVMVHSLVPSGKFGQSTIDLYRVTGGKIADHWEVIQQIPEFSASGRSMTGGPDTPLEPGRVKRAAKAGE